jgi:hypothetical protein
MVMVGIMGVEREERAAVEAEAEVDARLGRLRLSSRLS